MKMLVTVVGNRPQFIKVSALHQALRRQRRFRHVLIHTGQHYDPLLSRIFFQELDLPAPDYHLGIGSGTHGAQTGRMLETVETLLLELRPRAVLVYGDTNSTLAGALAAAKLHIPVAHVEAGLRSFNRRMPEEINRLVTDTVSDLLFAPTQAAVRNLVREGVPRQKIFQVGDVMLDAARYFAKKAEATSTVLKRLELRAGRYVLSTIHRAENTDDPQRLRAIFSGLSAVAGRVPVVLPLHPRTRKVLARLRLGHGRDRRLLLVDPVGYLDMVMLEKNACLIATDSGGVQKEAFFYKVPCVTLRDETEWVELVSMGWNLTVSPLDGQAIAAGILSRLHKSGKPGFPYGRGDASGKVLRILEEKLP